MFNNSNNMQIESDNSNISQVMCHHIGSEGATLQFTYVSGQEHNDTIHMLIIVKAKELTR